MLKSDTLALPDRHRGNMETHHLHMLTTQSAFPRWLTRICLAAVVVMNASAAFAVELKDPLTDPKHPDWIVDRAEKTGGSVEVGPTGVVMKSEPRNHVILKRSNDIVGTDANPLDVSVYCISTPGYVTHPGLHLYWDNANSASILFSVDNHIHLRWTNKNADFARDFYNVVPESKKNGIYMRFVLTSRNLFASMSFDGENWQR
jgi:hypothetical protein